MSRHALTYLATFLSIGLLDVLWLGVIALRWYQQAIGHLMAPKPHALAAAAFYLLYPVGVVIFAVLPSGGDWQRAMLLGALFGLFAYGTYDVTNLAVMRDWPLRITLVDIAWGSFASAAGAVAGTLALRALQGPAGG